MNALLLCLALAGAADVDSTRLFLVDVTARTVSADSALVVQSAGLTPRTGYTAAGFRLALQEAIRRVHGLGLFSQVEAETTMVADGVSVRFLTAEYPRVRRVLFEGFRRVRKKDLDARVKPREGEVLTDARVFNWQQDVLKLYKEKGFLLVQVTHDLSLPDTGGLVTLTYRIEEGDPVRIRDIQIVGNENFTDPQVEIKMVNRQKTWYRKGLLKEDEFVKDLDRIVEFYKQRGFIDARVVDYDMQHE
ncbi:hypothetical protein FJY71_07555, partial [candidate division WOR-3 bacterium]|nr:hypothetical protein [candidate division WOR-3 bacterium]